MHLKITKNVNIQKHSNNLCVVLANKLSQKLHSEQHKFR